MADEFEFRDDWLWLVHTLQDTSLFPPCYCIVLEVPAPDGDDEAINRFVGHLLFTLHFVWFYQITCIGLKTTKLKLTILTVGKCSIQALKTEQHPLVLLKSYFFSVLFTVSLGLSQQIHLVLSRNFWQSTVNCQTVSFSVSWEQDCLTYSFIEKIQQN